MVQNILLFVKILFWSTVLAFPFCCGSPSDNYTEALPSNKPLLRITTTMHIAPIMGIDVDTGGSWLVTASEDKSVKLWELNTGKLQHTFYLPAEVDDVGNPYCVSISPDGKVVAVGGSTRSKTSVFIYDCSTGEIINRISDFNNSLSYLKFSKDGHFLVLSVAGRSKGIRIYSCTTYSLLCADTTYSNYSVCSEFDTSGYLVTTCYDGFIRLYDPGFKLIHKYNTGAKPHSIDFTPDGKRVAVGYFDTGRVDVFDRNLKYLLTPILPGIPRKGENYACVAWSKDNHFLYAGGRIIDTSSSKCEIISWDANGLDPLLLPICNNAITGIKVLKNGNIIIASMDPKIACLDSNGNILWQKEPAIVDFRGQVQDNSIRSSQNGSRVTFGLNYKGGEPVIFDIDQQNLCNDTTASGLQSVTTIGLDFQNFHLLNSMGVKLAPNEIPRTLTYSPDSSSLVLGTEWSLRWYDTLYNLICGFRVPGTVWGLTISGDGKNLIAGFSDGTLRWYDYTTHKEKIALFIDAKTKEWVLWTPEGFFANSPHGATLIGYQINQGWDKSPEIVSGEQAYPAYYRPDIVLAKFYGEEDLITKALLEVGDIREFLQKALPPRLELAGKIADTIDGTTLTVPLRIIDRGGGIGQFEVRVNGILQQSKAASDRNLGICNIPVIVPPGRRSIVTFMCKSKIQEGKCPILSKPLTLPITSTASKDSTKQVLRALAIGVGNYRDQSKIIKNIANDVQRLQKTLLRYSKPIYDEIIIETLIDKNATRANITSAFQRIPDEINPGDVFLLYLSGHGVATGGKFCFLPYDFNFSESEALQDSSINSDILVSFMSRIPAHTLLYIIDACYAGTMAKELKQHPMFNYPFIGIEEKTAIDRLAMTSGRVGLYASGENSIALSGETGSLYTKLLIDGLSGKAANSDNYVTVNGLSDYLDSEVPRKSKELFGVEMFSKCDIVNLYNVLRLTYTKE